ncbi:hypothetical protein DERP_002734 [Dermatophagoides pteronyssinus]|uniref:Uncharacterized protein n=1 Tax=Dermatophagoides pteronyssinus TaxID=6956 RepID=A0ABQ8JVJ9_DERPT|nr:hypothetical protein DERP_002734 [Dermatophagoides pteronyssinus]
MDPEKWMKINLMFIAFWPDPSMIIPDIYLFVAMGKKQVRSSLSSSSYLCNIRLTLSTGERNIIG